MQAIPLGLDGLFVIEPDVAEQSNGRFSYFFSERDFDALGANGRCVQEHASFYPLAHTVRGLHFQTTPHAQTKFVRVAHGRIHDVVVDVRRGSPTYGRHAAVELAAGDYNDAALLRGVRWNDPALGIAWPCGDQPAFVFPVDRAMPLLRDLDSPFDWPAPRRTAAPS